MLEHVAWAEPTDRNLIAASDVPDMVQSNLREAIWGGSLFSDIESIDSSQRTELQEFMVETLDASGWTTDELAEKIEELGVDPQRAETIARSETAAAVNSAREDGYADRGLDDEPQFQWVGVDDNRTTEACTWLKEQTNPDFGGRPVTLKELQDLIAEAPRHDPEMSADLARPSTYVVHPNERHTYTRFVE